MKVTIGGWSEKDKAVIEVVTYWPNTLTKFVAIARAAREVAIHLPETVLAEYEET